MKSNSQQKYLMKTGATIDPCVTLVFKKVFKFYSLLAIW